MVEYDDLEVTTADPSTNLYKPKYTNGLDWNPNRKLHNIMLQRLLEIARQSKGAMSSRYDSWKKIDHNLTGFMPMDDEQYLEKQLDSRKPVAVVVPMTFAAREAILTYLTGTFLDRDIFFPIDGVGPEDTLGALQMQHVLQQQAIHGDAELALHTQWSDSITYGLGILAPHWVEEHGNIITQQPSGYTNIDGQFIQTGSTQATEPGLLWEGHKFLNIDPYKYLPDPNVPGHKVQDGEFVGWNTTDNYLNLLAEEDQDDDMFNVRYLSGHHDHSVISGDDSGRTDRDSAFVVDTMASTRPTDLLVLYRKVVPKEEGLGDSMIPEKWLFVVANDRVIIKAKKLELNHNMFPVVVCAPDYDGYTTAPTSRMETIFGLQETIDWFVTSHITNVRKAVNDTFVVDPFRINVNDITSREGKPGGIIRTRRASWGQGVGDAITQLRVDDVTRGHMGDSQLMASWMNQVTGASESLQGVFDNAPERRTAQEFNSTHGSATSRLAKYARIIHAQSMRPLTRMMIAHTIQFMQKETFIKVNGEFGARLAREFGKEEDIQSGRLKVAPWELNINYDITPSDGRSNADVDAQTLFQLMQVALSNPQILAKYDMPRIWAAAARRAGEKNIQDFEIQMSVQDDDTIRDAVAEGQLQRVSNVQ